MSVVALIHKSIGALIEDPSDNLDETPLLKALGGHDLSRHIEGTPTRSSHSSNRLLPNNPIKRLRVPRAKGRSEPVTSVDIPSGAHKALVIGLNGPMSHKERSLDYAVQDAKRFEKCLKELNNLDQQTDSQLSRGFDFNIELLTDEGGKCVPRTKVLRALDTLFSGAQPGDLLVLFFSGHCATIKPNGIVALLTVENNNSSRLVPSTVFNQYISKLPPGCTVEVFLDCCYSGGLMKLDNVIQEMAPTSVTSGVVHSLNHIAYGVSAAPPFSLTSSSSSGSPATTAGTSSTPCNPTQPLAALPGLNPNEKISTHADVIVWAASGATEKAYESCSVEGGPLANTICNKIEQSVKEGTIVGRKELWEQVTRDITYDNEKRQEILPGTYQYARILASSQDTGEIMSTPLFCKASGR
ncbi:caspase domain-containing protein [Rhizoctonia solani]|nr:caspase domain-containing protein [Rhizoctonia solani]